MDRLSRRGTLATATAAFVLVAAGALAQDAASGVGGSSTSIARVNLYNFVGKYSQFNVDARALGPDAGALGFDYDYAFSRNIGEEHDGIFDSGGKNFRLNTELELKGLLAAKPSDNALASHHYSLKFGGHHYSNDVKPLSPRDQVRILDILKKDPDELTTDEERLMRDWNVETSKRSRFWAWDGHFKSEASQDFSSYDVALGLGLAFDLASLHPRIAQVFDWPFTWLRSPSQQFRADAPRIFVGYDWVGALDKTNREAVTGNGDKSTHRFNAQVAWSTAILGKAIIKVLYAGHYEVAAPSSVSTANRDINHYVDASLRYPITDKLDVVAKYQGGRLPPDFGRESVGSVGFTLQVGDIGIF